MNTADWHKWFAYYPVYTPEYGTVWLRTVIRKSIPSGYVDHNANKSWAQQVSESMTGCWHRIPD